MINYFRKKNVNFIDHQIEIPQNAESNDQNIEWQVRSKSCSLVQHITNSKSYLQNVGKPCGNGGMGAQSRHPSCNQEGLYIIEVA